MSERGPRDQELPTVTRPRFEAPASVPTTYRLVVTAGPDQGRSFDLEGLRRARVFIGKSPSCDVCLTDPETSRRHVALDVTERGLRVTDLGSTNGTFIGDVAVVDAYVAEGQPVRIGATELRIESQADSARGAGPAEPAPTANRLGRVVGGSPVMQRLYPVCERLAQSNVIVIIEGETGTGKEVLAESLHEMGPRAAGPFVVFDCTAVPPNLVEGELFGHERGAFTGAMGARKGVFEQAHGGTLLIDEVGDLDTALQPKLLRVIERAEVRRLGGTHPIRVDVRILAATRRDLDREVQAGRFRDDLFHRLAVARLELPPLRRRRGDIELLAQHFWKELGGAPGGLPSTLLARWRDYPWPGNVRELRNAVARQIALGDLIDAASGDDEGAASEPTGATPPHDFIEEVLALGLPLTLARGRIVEEFERRYVTRVLDQHGGNVVRAAQASGIARRYLQKLKARQGR